MEYREIVSVTGLGGLYQLLATKSDGAIVKNLADQTTKFISARLHNVTPLESIEIYTTADNVRLHEVLQQMTESGDAMPNAKSAGNDEIRGYFKKVYPAMDEERVYVSDMKKMLKWYDILKANDLLNFEAYNKENVEAAEAAQDSASGEVVAEEAPDPAEGEKPAKKAAAKKAAKKDDAVEGEEKPAKKTAAKKAAKKDDTAEGEEKPAKKTAARKKAE